jgi:hypothetical protein
MHSMEKGERSKNKGPEGDYIFSKTITAGKRIYYLDVKQNRKGELFLVITESKKIADDNDPQNIHFEKHKIFLYKEEFGKFIDALDEVMLYIKRNNTVDFVPRNENTKTDETTEDISGSVPFNLHIDF